MGNVFDTLQERGFIYQVSDEAGLRAALESPVSVYCGYDPTDSSLTIGNLVSIMALRHMQDTGHKPIALQGGGTGMIGDPSDKSSARPMMTVEMVDSNLAAQTNQLAVFLDVAGERARVVNNGEWLRSIAFIDFLRDVGRHFSVNVMLDLEFVRTRLANQSGLSYLEFSYILLQAYDYLELYRRYGCTLQIGGSDQWANILAGADLIRRVEGGKAYALVTPLITSSSGRKISKSEGTAVYLDPSRTSPYEYYQYWINTEDADVERYLAIYTLLPMDEIRRLGQLKDADIRQAKEVLAMEATTLLHGRDEAERARETSRALFSGDAGAIEAAPTTEITPAEVASGMTIVDLLVRTKLASSKREARTLIDQRGVRLNGQEVNSVDRVLVDADVAQNSALLQKGRKTYHRVVVAP